MVMPSHSLQSVLLVATIEPDYPQDEKTAQWTVIRYSPDSRVWYS
jgi:hypothetical protein